MFIFFLFLQILPDTSPACIQFHAFFFLSPKKKFKGGKTASSRTRKAHAKGDFCVGQLLLGTDLPWSMADRPRVTPFKKTAVPSPNRHQLQTAWLGWDFGSTSPLCADILSDWNLYKSCVRHHSSRQFPCASVLGVPSNYFHSRHCHLVLLITMTLLGTRPPVSVMCRFYTKCFLSLKTITTA